MNIVVLLTGMDDLMQDLDGMFAPKQPRARKRDSETARGRQQRMDREPFTFGDWSVIFQGVQHRVNLVVIFFRTFESIISSTTRSAKELL